MSEKIETWMPLQIDEFLSSTLHLSTEEQAAYMRMLMRAWQCHGELPNDDRTLLNISGMTQSRWKKSKAVLLAFFYVSENGTLRQNNLDSQLASVRAGKLTLGER